MRHFDEFYIDKELREFRNYLTFEAAANPAAFDMFVNSQHKIKKLYEWEWPWSRKAAPADGGAAPAAPAPAAPAPAPAPAAPAPAPAQPPAPAAPAQPATQQQPAQDLPMAEPMDDGLGTKATSQALSKLLPNIEKSAKQRNPSNLMQVKKSIEDFKRTWVGFKKNMVQLLGAQGVANPQDHGLTYPLAPGQ